MNLKRHCLVILLLLAFVLQTGCGTLLYPERRGQTSGRIDPTVAILNGIGVLFFVIPGLIAFAVDFTTGAIYLPPDETTARAPSRVIELDPEEITPEAVAAAIYDQTGMTVTVTEEDLQRLRAGAR